MGKVGNPDENNRQVCRRILYTFKILPQNIHTKCIMVGSFDKPENEIMWLNNLCLGWLEILKMVVLKNTTCRCTFF